MTESPLCQDMARPEKIAKERIEYLYALAMEKLDDDPDQSRRSIEMLRDLATKHNLKIPELKKTFCKGCDSLLVPGKTCTVRVHDDRRVITCSHCGQVKRLGLT